MFHGGAEARPSPGGPRAATAAQLGGRGIARLRGGPLSGAAAYGESQFRGHLRTEGLSSGINGRCAGARVRLPSKG